MKRTMKRALFPLMLALVLLLSVLIFGVYGTGYDPQDFIYFKF